MKTTTDDLEPFALGGRQDGDEQLRSLFRDWIDAAHGYEIAGDEEGEEKAAEERWNAAEDVLDAWPCDTVVALSIKVFLRLRPDIERRAAPLPYIRPDAEASPLDISILRGLAKFVPEIAELVATVVHEDAELIDADMDIGWARKCLASPPTSSSLREEIEQKLAAALTRVARTEAKTDRGRDIKARHAVGVAAAWDDRRQRAQALLAEFGGPMPEATDAGIIEAERRLAALRKGARNLVQSIEDENGFCAPLNAAEAALVAFIEDTPVQGCAAGAAKLREYLIGGDDATAIRQVLAFLENQPATEAAQ